MRNAILIVSCVLAVAACGDNSSGDDATVDAAVPDAAVPDATSCPARALGAVGGGCVNGQDCDSTVGAGDGVCYVGTGASAFAPEGFCTLEDQVNGTYCDTDADCGDGNLCVDSLGYKFCLPACDCDNNGCPEHQACFNEFNGFPLDKMACVPGLDSAVDGDQCAGFYECNSYSACRSDNLEFPGGECAEYDCTVGDASSCHHGGHCIDVTGETPLVGTFCVDTCTDDNDCRGLEGYVCFDPGNAEAKYCRHPHVGDPCAVASDCGDGTWTCETGVGFTGGYCTQTGCPNPGSSADQCSPGSACADPLVGSNYCADRCDQADQGTQGRCRAGYVCLDTDPGAAFTGGCVPPASL